jgi:hypothetical protein
MSTAEHRTQEHINVLCNNRCKISAAYVGRKYLKKKQAPYVLLRTYYSNDRSCARAPICFHYGRMQVGNKISLL